jgi:hypothetical protein
MYFFNSWTQISFICGQNIPSNKKNKKKIKLYNHKPITYILISHLGFCTEQIEVILFRVSPSKIPQKEMPSYALD